MFVQVFIGLFCFYLVEDEDQTETEVTKTEVTEGMDITGILVANYQTNSENVRKL